MEPYEFLEWNNPFTGCTEREQLLTELQREYNFESMSKMWGVKTSDRVQQEEPKE